MASENGYLEYGRILSQNGVNDKAQNENLVNIFKTKQNKNRNLRKLSLKKFAVFEKKKLTVALLSFDCNLQKIL